MHYRFKSCSFPHPSCEKEHVIVVEAAKSLVSTPSVHLHSAWQLKKKKGVTREHKPNTGGYYFFNTAWEPSAVEECVQFIGVSVCRGGPW